MREEPYENPALRAADIPKSSNPLHKLLETGVDFFCVLDVDGCFLQISQAALRVIGYPKDYFINRHFTNFISLDNLSDVEAFIALLLSSKSVQQLECRIVNQNGEAIQILWSGVLDSEHNNIYCTGKEASSALLPTSFVSNPGRLLKQTLRVAKMGSWDYCADTNQLFWSNELFDLYGVDNRSSHQDLKALFFSLVHPDDLPIVRKYLQDINHLVPTFVHRVVRPDRKVLYVSQNISVLRNCEGKIVKLAGLTQDVNDCFQCKNQLEQSEHRFRSLIQTGSDIIGIIDSTGNYQYVSDNTFSLLGFDPQSLVGKNAFDFIHPEDAVTVYEQLSSFTVRNYMEVKPFRFRNAAGEWRWIETKVSNRIDEPSIRGLVVNSRDITDKKKFQDKLSKLSKIAEETSNAVVITDRSGSITWVNKAFEKITGYDFQEVEGKKPGAFLQGPLSDQPTISYMRQQLEKGESFNVEIVNYTKGGTHYWMEIQCQPQVDECGRLVGFFAIQTDITERKLLQQQLQEEVGQRQKRITSAIVKAQEKERTELSHELHDNVNQILTTVKLYLEMATDENGSGEFVAKARDMVQDSIEEIRRISKRLASPNLAELNLKHAIQELVDTIAMPGKINIDFIEDGLDDRSISDDVRLALYRIAQEQLTNIIKHACAKNVKVFVSVLADSLCLLVIDDGKGFDTRQKRKGIGVQNMRNRVETVNGKLEIKSQPGEGCTLMVSLPLKNSLKTGK